MDDTVADTLKLADAFNLLHVSWSRREIGKIAQIVHRSRRRSASMPADIKISPSILSAGEY
jgi:hypothetical protein